MMDHLIIGIGDAGNNIVEYIHRHRPWSVLMVNTDAQALAKQTVPRKLLIGPHTCGGSAAHSSERGRAAAEESSSDVDRAIANYSTVVVVTGLGGGTGTGATPIIIEKGLSLGKRVIAAVALPYEFETKGRAMASEALDKLRLKPIQLVILDNNDLLKGAGRSMGLNDAMEELSCRMAAGIDEALRTA